MKALLRNYFKKIHNSKYAEFYSFSFLLSFLLTLVLYFVMDFSKLTLQQLEVFYANYITTIFGSSASIFGISLAALSVFISVIYRPAIPKMSKDNLLEIFLYPFFVTVLLWGGILLSSLIIFLRSLSPLILSLVTAHSIYFSFLIFLIITAIFYTIALSHHVIKTTLISFLGEK